MVAPLRLTAANVDFVLLDIEGTTTPIAFVHDVLFPYARSRVPAYLEETAAIDSEIRQVVEDLRTEAPASGFPLEADVVSYVYWLMDRDRKSGPLKALQGRIWEQGYATGALKGEVYPDVPEAFARWTTAGVRIGIYSSGSVLAQKLLFANSTAGDLSRFISGYFDTAVGAKKDAVSYRRIVEALGITASRVLFVSDVVSELDAAREAGLRTMLCVRPPAQPPAAIVHGTVQSIAEIEA